MVAESLGAATKGPRQLVVGKKTSQDRCMEIFFSVDTDHRGQVTDNQRQMVPQRISIESS